MSCHDILPSGSTTVDETADNKKQTALITGATGHVGRVLCERIAKPKQLTVQTSSNKIKQNENNSNDDINNLLSSIEKDFGKIIILGRNVTIGSELENKYLNVEFIKCDISDSESVNTLLDPILSSVDVIFHCAALSTSWARATDLYKANVQGTMNLANLALAHYKKNKKLSRFVFVGTPSIYMSREHLYNVSENNDETLKMENMLNEYAKTKYMAEQFILSLYREHQFPVVSIRPRAVIGIHDTAILPRITQVLRERRFVNISEKDKPLLIDLTYIDNVVDALLLAYKRDKCLGKAYNITNGEPLDLHKLCKELSKDYLNIDLNYEKKTGPDTFVPKKINFTFAYFIGYIFECVFSLLGIYDRDPPLSRYAVATISRSATFDLSNAQRDLGYSPRVPIREGIQKVMRASKL
ncbi:predicted protein [Naegleria gruberi]|uniref:Predicted protein n=1 Tax=Naegleria gruberi TaxID=5762 RepID=D2VA64_NAEGR|nr:uncharacterized protein NAEGRDRAFT_47886 [Naegleria gruberi]EFC46374.1 predicted protein [Naegleria gruberi]|eukprot:XP_002679118.1 predicted protein [Naegleria gruberi strain NEG-M]